MDFAREFRQAIKDRNRQCADKAQIRNDAVSGALFNPDERHRFADAWVYFLHEVRDSQHPRDAISVMALRASDFANGNVRNISSRCINRYCFASDTAARAIAVKLECFGCAYWVGLTWYDNRKIPTLCVIPPFV